MTQEVGVSSIKDTAMKWRREEVVEEEEEEEEEEEDGEYKIEVLWVHCTV